MKLPILQFFNVQLLMWLTFANKTLVHFSGLCSFGVFMVELIEHFDAHSEYVAWIGSLQFAQTIISSMLFHRVILYDY